MMFTNSKGIIIATIALFYDGNRARAFVPEDTRVRIGGGRGLISTPPESLSLKECQQRSPRLSEAGFRLDYVQGVRPPQKIHAVEKDDHKKTDDGTYATALFYGFQCRHSCVQSFHILRLFSSLTLHGLTLRIVFLPIHFGMTIFFFTWKIKTFSTGSIVRVIAD